MRYRIDPAGDEGFHLVDVENGGEQVYIPYDEKHIVIDLIRSIKR